MAAKFEIYQDDDGKHRFRLLAANSEVVADSQPYDSAGDAVAGMGALKRAAAEAVVPDESIHMHY